MSWQSCVHCGKETGEGELYCPECQAISGSQKPRRLWLFSILFSGLLLSLTGLLIWHGGLGNWSFSLGSLWGKPAAVINGEVISRAEFKARMNSVQVAVERQYGKNIFSGQRGRVLLDELEEMALDAMLNERLVAQEAGKLKIVISDQQVEEELQKISKEIYGSREKFQARLREDGISEKELKTDIRNLLLYNAVKAAKTPAGADPQIAFNAWLAQVKRDAELISYQKENRGSSAFSPVGSCCQSGSSAGGCGPTREGGAVDPKMENEAQKAALEAYQKTNPAEKGVTARVTNYGCHIQVDIQKEGRIVKSYIYQGGRVFENS